MKPGNIKIFVLLGTMALAVSCEGFLTKTPNNKFSANDYFSNESRMKLYANGLIQGALPAFSTIAIGNDAYTDICATKTSTTMYLPGIYSADRAGGWTASDFSFLRRVNYMIQNMPYGEDKVSPEIYAHYMGVARFWRAYRHWALIKEYSDIPWIDHVVNKDEDMLYAPRDDREYVFHKVLEDIDYACNHCLTGQAYNVQSRTVINGWIAWALKAKMCLYEGSYRKYHRTNPSTNKEWNNKYETADDLYAQAIAACEKIMSEGSFSLHTGNVMSAYSDLFLSEDIPSDEVIWSRQANEALNVMHQITMEYNSPTAAQKYSPTKELVNMYLKLDGTPIATDKVSVADEFTDRDYRLIQTVMGPGHTWGLNNGTVEAKAPNWTYVLTGYEFCKWNIEKQYAYTATRCNNSMPIIRYAEILLIYAEAMEETGQMDESVWENTVGAIRRRSGVASIYPGSAAYKVDPILTAYYNGDGIGKDFSYSIGLNMAYNITMVKKYKGKLVQEWRQDDDGNDVYYNNIGDVAQSGFGGYILEDHVLGDQYLFKLYRGTGEGYSGSGEVDINAGPKDGMIRTKTDMDWVIAMISAGYTFKGGQPVTKNTFYYGDFIYADLNGDGNYGDDNDHYFTGHSNVPKITAGLNLSARWKGFDVYALFTGAFGFYLNWNASINTSKVNLGQAIPRRIADDHYYYDPAGDESANNINATYPRLVYNKSMNNESSDFYHYRGDYVKLKSIQFGYTLPKKIVEKVRTESCRIFVSGENLLTFTNYPGLDPEIGTSVGYPLMRNVCGGIQVTF